RANLRVKMRVLDDGAPCTISDAFCDRGHTSMLQKNSAAQSYSCQRRYTTIDHSPHICKNEYNKYMYSFEVMSVATSIRLTDELEHRIKKLAATTGRSQSFYINQIIEDGIDRVEQIYGILHETEQYQAGDLHTYSSDDRRHELGLER